MSKVKKIVTACLLALAGCANYPADLIGKPIDDAVSLYGQPKAAVDFEGARVFYFEVNEDGKPETIHDKELTRLLNPSMNLSKTDFKSDKCVYTFNALWGSYSNQWTIHSVSQSQPCGLEEKENAK